MIFFIALSSILALTYSSHSTLATLDWDSLLRTELETNLIGGTCRWGQSSSSSEVDVVVKVYSVTQLDEQEWSESQAAQAEAETRATWHLLTGLYKGVDQLTPWRNSTRTHFATPRSHPRNSQKELCIRAGEQAITTGAKVYANLSKPRPYYTMHAKHVLVNSLGIVALPCGGYWQGHESCLNNIGGAGRGWRRACEARVPKEMWNTWLFDRGNVLLSTLRQDQGLNLSLPKSRSTHRCFFEGRILGDKAPHYLRNPNRVERLFLMTAAWDYNMHHAIFEGLLRIFTHLDFLRKNPRIRIHQNAEDAIIADPSLRCGSCRRMREGLLEFFNISKKRIIRGVVAADEVYIPRAIHCSSPFSHALELRKLAKTMLGIAHGLPDDTQDKTLLAVHDILPTPPRPVIVVQRRRCVDEIPKNQTHWHVEKCNERAFNDTFFQTLMSDLELSFGNTHKIVEFESSPSIGEQIRVHAAAQVLIGLHGAGLTHVMWMKPKTLLVELAGFWDARVLPICGHYGPLSAVFGVNHLIINWDSQGRYMTWDRDEMIETIKRMIA